MFKRVCTMMMIIFLTMFIMGCWDRIELEERGFVIAVSIDTAKDVNEDQSSQDDKSGRPEGTQRFVGTFQFVIPGALSGEKGGMSSKKGESSSEASFNISSVGDTMDTLTTELSTRTSRTPFFEHLQVIIVSEEVARSEFGFANIMDYFLRNQGMRRNIKILVAKGEASKVLEARPPNEKLPAMYIRSIAENTKSARMLPESRIGDLVEHLLSNESFAIQKIVGYKQGVKIAGSAVFRGGTNNLVGFLDEEETEGLNYITGEISHGIIRFKVKDNLVLYDIENITRQIKAEVKRGHKLQFTIHVQSEGNIGESFERLDFTNPKVLQELEMKIGEEIERLMRTAINKVQKEYEKDVLGLGRYLRENHYEVWKKVRGNWDTGENYFAQSSIRIHTDVTIHRIGIHNKTEMRKE